MFWGCEPISDQWLVLCSEQNLQKCLSVILAMITFMNFYELALRKIISQRWQIDDGKQSHDGRTNSLLSNFSGQAWKVANFWGQARKVANFWGQAWKVANFWGQAWKVANFWRVFARFLSCFLLFHR